MQIVFIGDDLHDTSNPICWENKNVYISKCLLLKLLPSMLSVNVQKCKVIANVSLRKVVVDTCNS